MIPKAKIKEFLRRPLDDMGRFKKLTRAELEAKLREKGLKLPKLWAKLRHHQKVSFVVGALYHRQSFWLDTGCGKTLLSIVLARHFRRELGAKRTLVLVPNNINRYEWRREIKKHSPNTSCMVLSGSTENKWNQLLSSKSTLVIATYIGITRMVTEPVRLFGKKKHKLMLSPTKLQLLVKQFRGLVNDESTSIGNHRSLYFRICRQLAKRVDFLFNLSGTPFGADPTPLWAQMYLVDGGKSLGKNLGIFRAAFFTSKINYWSGWPEYTFDKRRQKDLHRLLRHRSLRYEANQADLPEVVSITKEVRLPSDAATYYKAARDRLFANKGNYREQNNSFLRMRQISSGFLGYHDDDLGKKAQFEFPVKPKLELLSSLVQAIDPAHKIVIMHDFIFSGDLIARELDRLKIGYARLHGKVKKSEAPNQLHRFDHDPKCRVFVINAAGAFGLNLQVAKYQLFYESPTSPLLRKQMERRVERQESKHEKVFRYDLIVRQTVDSQIRASHRAGVDLFRSIVEGKTVAV